MDDYAFFAQVWKWPPSEINNMGWSYRKKLKQAYKDNMANIGPKEE